MKYFILQDYTKMNEEVTIAKRSYCSSKDAKSCTTNLSNVF